MLAEYEPLALARGFDPVEVTWTRPDTPAAAPGDVEVVCVRRLPDVAGFWRARAGAGHPEAVAFWATTDAVARTRSRRVGAPVPAGRSLMLPSAPMATPTRVPAPPTTTRAIVVGTPVGDPATAAAALTELAGRLPGLLASHAGPHLPGVVAPAGLGPGACTWDLLLDAPPHAADGSLDRVLTDERVRALLPTGTRVVLSPIAMHRVAETCPTVVKRTLLLTVRAGASGAAVARFEADLLAMPAHISTIRSWSLARVVGDSPWTHVWEQEFAEVTGLTGAYLGHPHHWAVVDGWFDPEMPDRVVEPVLAHLFGERAPSLGTLLGD